MDLDDTGSGRVHQCIYEANGEGGLAPIRIGIHLGDDVQGGTDIHGDALISAARIEPAAEPGGICLPGAVYEQVRNKCREKLQMHPPAALKGLQLPMNIYRVVLPWSVRETATADEAPYPLDKIRIAVRPFVSVSPGPNDEYFLDEITEELIVSLAPVKGLQVMARASAMKYKKQEKSVSEFGKELGVLTVVEGNVRKAGDRLRFTSLGR
ncbi:MAG: hypothetical protein WA547_02410 [Thermoplasmata archaeon]